MLIYNIKQELGRSNVAFEQQDEDEDYRLSSSSASGRSRNPPKPRQRQQVRDVTNGLSNVAFQLDDDQQSITPPPPYPAEVVTSSDSVKVRVDRNFSIELISITKTWEV